MGSATSRIWSMSPNENQYGTPLRRHEILNDPRSPIEEIHRTPIVVESASASFVQSELDPRSPACGFQRTPIIATQSLGDPRSPSVKIVRTPVDDVKRDFPSTDRSPSVVYLENLNTVTEANQLQDVDQEKFQDCQEKQPEVVSLEPIKNNSPAKRRPKQLFGDAEFSLPRTPLAVTNRPNISLRIRAQQRAHVKHLDTDLVSTRKTPTVASEDKENSPLFITNM